MASRRPRGQRGADDDAARRDVQRAADAGDVTALVRLLLERGGSDEAKARAAAALCDLCDGHSGNQQRAADAGAIAALVRLLLEGGSDQAKANAALALGAVCKSHSTNQQRAADASAMVRLLQESGNFNLKLVAATALSSVCAGHSANSEEYLHIVPAAVIWRLALEGWSRAAVSWADISIDSHTISWVQRNWGPLVLALFVGLVALVLYSQMLCRLLYVRCLLVQAAGPGPGAASARVGQLRCRKLAAGLQTRWSPAVLSTGGGGGGGHQPAGHRPD